MGNRVYSKMKNDKLDICKICINRKYELTRGIYCGLTDKKPEFENRCPNFVLDVDQKLEDIQNSWITNKKYLPNGAIYIESGSKLKKLVENLSNEYKIIRSTSNAIGMISVFPIFTIGIFLGLLKGEIIWESFVKPPYLLIFVFYILSIPISLEGIKLYKSRSPIISLSLENGITFHEKNISIPWNKIMCTYINIPILQKDRIELRLITYDNDEPFEYVLPEISISRKKLIYLAEAYRIKSQIQALTMMRIHSPYMPSTPG